MSPPIVLVSPLRAELTGVLARLNQATAVRTGRRRVVAGELAGRPVRAAWIGDGAERSARGLEGLLDADPCGGLIILGVAGGLSADAVLGARIVARTVVGEDGPAPAPDRAWCDRWQSARTARFGTLVSRDRIASGASQKRALFASLGDGSVSAAVDLETASLAKVAASRGVPYVAVRAISDPASEDLPLDFARFQRADGSVRTWAVALAAIRRPAVIGPLRMLRDRVAACAVSLAESVCDAVEVAP